MAPTRTVTPIGSILRRYLRKREMDTRARQEQIRLSWREIVGEVIARVSSIQRIAQGVAYVSCATPVWAQTLSLRRKEILAKVREHVGSGAIREIRFNSLPGRADNETQPRRNTGRAGAGQQREKPLTESQEQMIAAIAASLEEKSTRRASSRKAGGARAEREGRKS